MISLDQMKQWYYEMVMIRKVDFSVNDLLRSGLMFGFSHQYIGQEAIAVGVCDNLLDEDYISSHHRGHGHCFAKNGEEKYILSELLGKATGYCHGNGGSAHIADQNVGNLGANGIVGGGVPIAIGAALASKIRGLKRIAVAFFGDGACNQGSVMEAMNFAAALSLPVLFVCENNGYAVSTSFEYATKVESVAKRAEGFGIPSERIDGNQVDIVYETAKRAIEQVRRGGGPYLIECMTYRWKGHSTNDLALYRTEEELNSWKERCPIKDLMAKLLSMGASEEDLTKIEQRVENDYQEALQFAIDSPYPDFDSSFSTVYAK